MSCNTSIASKCICNPAEGGQSIDDLGAGVIGSVDRS